jgi:PKD repeat protein
MIKNMLIPAAALVFAALPLTSSAQTALVMPVSAVVTASTTAPAVQPVESAAVCAPIVRSLTVGVTGSDVAGVQAFLHEHGYLNVSPTGYFGPLTRAAVAHWQADGGVVAEGGFGSGVFGPRSRAYFSAHACGGTPSNPVASGFSASPRAGAAPLTVQFTSSAPQGTTLGSSVDFGDGATGTLAFVPVCSNCNALGTVTHTYTAPGAYTASLMSGSCACPASGVCNCPMMQVLATTTVSVASTTTAPANISQVNAPGNVTLGVGGIAEVRNERYYFTLTGVTNGAATIQPTAVGCWNHFPSDTPPQIVCMIAVMPLAPQTLYVGQSYTDGAFNIQATQIGTSTATFAIGTPQAK